MLTANLDPDVRTSPMRQRIYDAVAENPGRTFLDLVRCVGIGYGAAQYHLYVLEWFGLIHHVKAGRSVHYYPTGGVDLRAAREDAYTADSTRRAILDHVRAEPGARLGALTSLSAKTRQTTAYHVAQLRDQGLVDVREDPTNARSRRVYPLDAPTDKESTGCLECRRGPCNIALLPGETCSHGCGCVGTEVPA